MEPASSSAVVELKGISKTFGAVHANRDININIRAGEVHGLIGENGAGKSTVMKILYGMNQPDTGDIFIQGKKTQLQSPLDAINKGIGMVHQHFMLVESLTVLENIFLGSERTQYGLLKEDLARAAVADVFAKIGIKISLHKKVQELTVGQQQQVEIAKVLFRNASIIILDEPTAVLTPQETQALFETIRKLKALGHTFIIISHKLDEILEITERITVLRNGQVSGEVDTASTSKDELIQLMIGRTLENITAKTSPSDAQVRLRASSISAHHPTLSERIANLSFDVAAGEILGVAGIMGNGQRTLEEALTLCTPIDSGKLECLGEDISDASSTYLRKLRRDDSLASFGYVPEDRHRMAVVLERSIADNMLIGHLETLGTCSPFWISKSKTAKLTQSLMEDYDVQPRAHQMIFGNLSGGNQQKAVIARELHTSPQFALISQPTRGVDIGSIELIYEHIIQLRNQGSGILLISADLDEIYALSDRIMVLYEGRSQGIFDPATTSRQALGEAMMGCVDA